MRKLLFLLITICGVVLTGCAQLIDLTENESDVLAEYMAGTMLRHAENYEEALIYPEETTEEKEAAIAPDMAETASETDLESHNITGQSQNNTAVQSSENNKTVAQSSENNKAVAQNLSVQSQYGTIVSLANMFKGIFKNSLSITYQNYKAYDSYPDENELFTIEPAEGKKLIAFTFNVKNITKKTHKLDLLKYNISYQLTDNNSSVYYPMMTLLANDIQYINLGIDAGKTRKAVILFELPEKVDMSHLLLTLTYEDKTTFLDISQ